MASILDTPTSNNGSATLTFAVSAGTNRCLIVGVQQEGNQAGAPTASYGGQGMTNVVDNEINPGTTSCRSTLFFLNDAGIEAAGTTTITISNAVGTEISIHAASYEECVQTTPTNTDTDGSTAATPNPLAALDITTVSANSVVCALSSMGNSGTAAWGLTLTERTEQSPSSSTGSYADDEVPSATTIACECTMTTQNRASAVALELVHDPGITYEITGITKNNAGSVLGSCEVQVWKMNVSFNDATLVDSQTSNVSTGVYAIATPDNDARYFAIAVKDGTDNVMDTTDHILTPTEV